MASKLDEMKGALADYDAKMASVDEEYGYWSSRNAAAFAPDYLRTLLAVAEAAEEYKRNGGYEPMAKLFDALKALD